METIVTMAYKQDLLLRFQHSLGSVMSTGWPCTCSATIMCARQTVCQRHKVVVLVLISFPVNAGNEASVLQIRSFFEIVINSYFTYLCILSTMVSTVTVAEKIRGLKCLLCHVQALL